MKVLIVLFGLFCPFFVLAQKIVYTTPEQEDSKRTAFEIIGKVNGNILVFKNNRSENAISVYDMDLKLIQRVKLDFLPDRYINVDFVQYPDFAYMIYEYERKNIVHCTMVKLDGMAHHVAEPIDLDTTQIGFSSSNKIYNVVVSEDKQKIMLLKINSKNPKNYVFTSHLFDNNLQLIDRHRIEMQLDERNHMFTSFHLDNDGQLVFGRYLKNNGNQDYVSKVAIVTKAPLSDTFSIKDIGTNERLLDEIKLKVDNNNKKYILTGFYYKQKRGNIEGLYTVLWDKATDSKIRESVTIFNDELRSVAKSSESTVKMALNDYFIKNIITLKNGGYLLVSESEYTTSRGNAFNRWDYMGYGYNPMLGPMDYYSPYYNPYSPYNRFGYGNPVRYNSENILVLSFDKDCNLLWSNVIPKSQYDDESDNLISHHIMNTGGELHFLYNQFERRTMLLADQSVAPDGKLTRYPTLRYLDKGYDFMPRYGKQISSQQIIIPCLYRNYLCFAKLEF